MAHNLKINTSKTGQFIAVVIVFALMMAFFSDILNLFKVKPAEAALPTFVSCGVATGSTGTISPGLPSGIATDDILLLFLETANEAISVANGNGGTWAEVTNSPQGTGTGGATGATRLTVFWSRYNGTQGAPTTSDSGDHQVGSICAYRGVTPVGDPWDVTSGAVDATSDTSGSIPSATTSGADRLVVIVGVGDDDADTPITTVTNASLANISVARVNAETAQGNDGGLTVFDGEKSSAGAYGITSLTYGGATTKGMMAIALKHNEHPSLSISQPDGTSDTIAQDASYNITYTLSDADSTVTSAFYYDTNNSGLDGTVILGACATAVEGTNATCAWSTTSVTPGAYYIYGISSDGVTQVSAYSPGVVTINARPTLSISQPDGVGDSVSQGDLYNITYTLSDADSTVTSAFYYDTNNSGLDGTAISGACATAVEGTNATCSWDTSGVSAGSYYVYGITNDGINSQVSAYSPGQIAISGLQITVSTTGAQTASMNIPSSDQYVGGAFTFQRNSGSATVTQIIVSETGSINAETNLSNLKLYYETTGSCSFGGTETLFGTATSFNASQKATITGSMSVGASQVCVYAVLDVGSGATNGQTLEIEISNPSTEVTASAGTVAPVTAVAISGTTTVSLSVPGAPGTPTFSNIGETSLRVNWTASTGEVTGYKVERCQGSGCTNFSQIASGVATLYYDDSSLSANTIYRYQVRATNATGDGAYSGIGTTLTLPGTPGTPTFSSVGETSLRVNWTAPAGGATSYKVERCQGSGCSSFSQIVSGVTDIFYDDSSLSANTIYRYQVRATNASGDGAYSGIGDVTTSATPIITTATVDNQASSMYIPSTNNYVGGAFTFTRSAGSADITQIIITETGDVNAETNLSNLKLYYETTGSCSFGGTETLFGTATSFNASQKATITGSMSVGASQVCVYAVLDVGSGATEGQVLEIAISNPSTEVTASAGLVSPATTVAISGTTTLSVVPSITTTTVDNQVSTMIIPSTNNYVGGAFTFIRNTGSTNITQIILTETGTVNANTNTSSVKIYYETAATCSYGGTETLFGSGSFDGSAKATITGSMPVGTSRVCAYVVLNVGSGASDNQTLEIEISNPSTEVTASVGTVAPAIAVAISGTTTLLVKPVVTSISPDNGKLAGGTNVTITGTGFLSGASVSFGGSSATNIFVVSATTITATTPSHTSGAVDVVVTNTNAQSGTLTGGYTYNTFPTVSDINPTTGPIGGNTSVTITGTGFLSGASVSFGGSSATNISVVSSTSITATTPAHSAGAADVIVTNTDTQFGTLTNGFSYTAGPVITSISPDNGKLSGGASVTITGGNFQNGATISFDGAPATNVVFVSSTSITATTPSHAAGTVNITVTNPDAQSHTLTGGYTYNPLPTISSVSPSSGSISGTNITVTGTGFLSGASVSFGGSSANNIAVVSGTSITATTLAHAIGTVDVVVTNTDTQSGTLLNGFSYVSAPSLNLTANPTSIFSGELSVLNWTSSDATSCTASGSWSGSKSTTGNEVVSPTTTSTYTLTCSGPGGSSQGSVVVTVSAQTQADTTGPTGPQFRFEGFAYANGTVIVYDGGVPMARLVTGDDGSFSTIFRTNTDVKHLYGIIAYDKNKQSSPTKTFPSDLYSSRSVSNILIAPTISLNKRMVSRNGAINVYGYATPERKVKIEIDGKTEKEIISSATGYYSITIGVSRFSEGSHKIRAKQIDEGRDVESDYSILKLFNVGEVVVANTDLNGDRVLNITDWSIFLSSWSSKDQKARAKIDLSGDGKIDISDLSIFLKSFSKK